MENTFIVRYRRALRELQEAYKLQYALIDESNELLTIAYQQVAAAEKAILKNRKTGWGFLKARLTECIEAELTAWVSSQQLKRKIEEMEEAGYDSVVDNDQNRALYYVTNDALSCLMDLIGNYFPKKITCTEIATYRGSIPLSEVALKFGTPQLKRLVNQQLDAAPPISSIEQKPSIATSLAITEHTRSTTIPILTHIAPDSIAEWSGLLCQPEAFGLNELRAAFKAVGLLGSDDNPTAWGIKNKGAWAGALDELTAHPALLVVNARAVCRCLAQWGVKLTENTLRNNVSLTADNTRKAMKQVLKRK